MVMSMVMRPICLDSLRGGTAITSVCDAGRRDVVACQTLLRRAGSSGPGRREVAQPGSRARFGTVRSGVRISPSRHFAPLVDGAHDVQTERLSQPLAKASFPFGLVPVQ